MGPIDAVLGALDLYSAELKKQSQTLQPTKTVIYLLSTPTVNGTETIMDLCAARGYTAGPGFLAAGSPVGDPAYCQSTIKSLFTAIAQKINAIRTLSHVSAGRTAKPQDIYRVLHGSTAPASIGYLIRTTPTGLIACQAALFDDATFQCILDILKVPPSEPIWNPISSSGMLTAEIVHLNACAGGLGVTSAAELPLAHKLRDFFSPCSSSRPSFPNSRA